MIVIINAVLRALRIRGNSKTTAVNLISLLALIFIGGPILWFLIQLLIVLFKITFVG